VGVSYEIIVVSGLMSGWWVLQQLWTEHFFKD
jgi:hypothetical protein